MGRHIKQGLDYFPIDLDLDDKWDLIESKYGLEGFAMLIKLLQRIYKNGYYTRWTEREQLLFSKNINVDINRLSLFIDDCINFEIFDARLLEKYSILTSRGIQKRYLLAVTRRKQISICKEILLLDIDVYINDSSRVIYADINTQSGSINASKSTQSKVKESKVKESILGETSPPTAVSNRPLYHLIENAFVSQAPQIGDNAEFNYNREGPHIKELEGKALARDSPEEFAKTVIVVFWRLIHSADQFWKKQPFLPSVLNSGGIWPRVLKEMENHREEQLDERLQEIIGGLKF